MSPTKLVTTSSPSSSSSISAGHTAAAVPPRLAEALEQVLTAGTSAGRCAADVAAEDLRGELSVVEGARLILVVDVVEGVQVLLIVRKNKN